jgi:hypothetical protein
MNHALNQFKKNRPEEYQEYKGYQRRNWRISLGFYSACVTATGVVLVSFVYFGSLGGILIMLGLFGCLVCLYRKLSHIRSVLKLSIALLEMTFNDQINIPLETLAQLKDIFREDLEENKPLVPHTFKEIQR